MTHEELGSFILYTTHNDLLGSIYTLCYKTDHPYFGGQCIQTINDKEGLVKFAAKQTRKEKKLWKASNET